MVLKASFSNTVILIFTFGWAVIYSVAIVCQSVLPGSWVVICHHSIVTGLGAAVAVAGTAVAGTAVAGGVVGAGGWVGAGAVVG